MNMNPISFKGTFCVDRDSIQGRKYNKILSKQDEYNIIIEPYDYGYPDKVFIHTPFEYDVRMIKMLSKLKINYRLIP